MKHIYALILMIPFCIASVVLFNEVFHHAMPWYLSASNGAICYAIAKTMISIWEISEK